MSYENTVQQRNVCAQLGVFVAKSTICVITCVNIEQKGRLKVKRAEVEIEGGLSFEETKGPATGSSIMLNG